MEGMPGFFAVHRRTRNVGTIGPKQKKGGSERKRDKLIIQNYFVLSFFCIDAVGTTLAYRSTISILVVFI